MNTAAVNVGGNVAPKVCLSIGILAWNEEDSIGVALEALFEQSVFQKLAGENMVCEVLCLANGCTDNTVPLVTRIFAEQMEKHPYRQALSARCYDVKQRGRNHSWNLFVHELSAREAQCLYLMDGDIVLRHPDTIWNLYQALASDPNAAVASDTPIKDISLKEKPSLRERISLMTSRMNQSGHALMTGQLYGIKAEVIRNIYLPKDLVACEDGLIRALSCSQFLTRELDPRRIVRVAEGSHVFEAYTSLPDVVKNQKRQIIGQTIVHILIDKYFRQLPAQERLQFADTVREHEKRDPDWLKRLIGSHLREVKHFWNLFPGIMSFRFRRLARLKGRERLKALPAALAGFLITSLSAWMAWRFLKKGNTDYWPLTHSTNLRQLKEAETPRTPSAVPVPGAHSSG